MLIILMLFLIIFSILVLVVKRNKETFYIFSMCLSLAILITGIMLYIAKKGGISDRLQDFYFFNPVIKSYAQYFYITIDALGYMVAIGRYIFPLFLLLLAIHYSGIIWLKRSKFIAVFVFLSPVISLILYYPTFFRYLNDVYENYTNIVSHFSLAWVLLYILLSVSLLIVEVFSIQIKIFRSKFIVIIFFVISILFLYLLYFGQDPTQIYQFYYSGNGIYYMNAVLSVPAYLTIITINIVLAIIGFICLLKYTKDMFDANNEEITIQRSSKVAHAGSSVFVHSLKNQLLANRVLFKRINNEKDQTKLRKYTDQLFERNESMLDRIEELYQSVKTQSVHLVTVSLEEVISISKEKFYKKYPEKKLQINISEHAEILADAPRLSEAVYNLLTNAQEAVNSRNMNAESGVFISSYPTRQYHVIEVRDTGTGIERKNLKKIMEPFYSTKNSNFNWGMGLHYVQVIVKEHFGILRYESKEGEGSAFFIFLPKLK